MLILTLAEKGGDSKDLSFDKTEIRVGRVRDNDIVLPKGNVSKHHCRLLLQSGQLVVEDMGSTNGTYVNGRKITEATSLGTTDKVFVGDFVIRVGSGARAAESPISLTPPPYSPSAPEAGSLSSALPRRPPPPSAAPCRNRRRSRRPKRAARRHARPRPNTAPRDAPSGSSNSVRPRQVALP